MPDEKTKTAVKSDGYKVRHELMSTEFRAAISRVLTFGAEKYEAHNWARGFDWSRLIGACERHLEAFKGGEEYDPETGEHHLAHLGCEVMFLLEHALRGLGHDDRLKLPALLPVPSEVTAKRAAALAAVKAAKAARAPKAPRLSDDVTPERPQRPVECMAAHSYADGCPLVCLTPNDCGANGCARLVKPAETPIATGALQGYLKSDVLRVADGIKAGSPIPRVRQHSHYFVDDRLFVDFGNGRFAASLLSAADLVACGLRKP